jgi:hypothetical protein
MICQMAQASNPTPAMWAADSELDDRKISHTPIAASPASTQQLPYAAMNATIARRRRHRRLLAATWRRAGSASGSIMAQIMKAHMAMKPPASSLAFPM